MKENGVNSRDTDEVTGSVEKASELAREGISNLDRASIADIGDLGFVHLDHLHGSEGLAEWDEFGICKPFNINCIVEMESANLSPDEIRDVGAASNGSSQVVGQSADIGASGADNSKLPLFALSAFLFKFFNKDLSALPFYFDALTGIFIQGAAVFLHGAVHGWNLGDFASELRELLGNLSIQVTWHRPGFDDLTFCIVGFGFFAKFEYAQILFGFQGQVLEESGGGTDCCNEEALGDWV